MRSTYLPILLASFAFGGIGCDDATDPMDAGPDISDASTSSVDAMTPADSGMQLVDGAVPADASTSVDAGMSADAAVALDASSTPTGCEGVPASDLCFLREEEKLARDVYLELFDETGIRLFQNIARSEQTHTDAVRDVLAARSIPDPVVDDSRGVFVDPILAGLYRDLTAAGRASDVAALTVGATIEDLDIRDISDMAARSTEADVTTLYESLSCGSRNHMRSFASQLESRGETYVPQYITTDVYEAIVGSARETCGG